MRNARDLICWRQHGQCAVPGESAFLFRSAITSSFSADGVEVDDVVIMVGRSARVSDQPRG